jgi:hypothetical protein
LLININPIKIECHISRAHKKSLKAAEAEPGASGDAVAAAAAPRPEAEPPEVAANAKPETEAGRPEVAANAKPEVEARSNADGDNLSHGGNGFDFSEVIILQVFFNHCSTFSKACPTKAASFSY